MQSTATQLPTFESYGEYASSNYGAHTLRFVDDRGSYWFSYSTLVAFKAHATPLRVIENQWGPTTGKHLNWIDGGRKSARLAPDAFHAAYAEDFGA